MRDPAVGAYYYRISISEADANGNPTGTRFYYGDGLAWEKVVGADIVPELLDGGEGRRKQPLPDSGQTTRRGSGRYAIML